MNELCQALQPELAMWIQSCAALERLLAGEFVASRVTVADGFSLVARSTAALAAKHSWVTRHGQSLSANLDPAPPPDNSAAT